MKYPKSKKHIPNFRAVADTIGQMARDADWTKYVTRHRVNSSDEHIFLFRRGAEIIAKSARFDTPQERDLAYASVMTEFGRDVETEDDRFFQNDSFGEDLDEEAIFGVFDFGDDLDEDFEFDFTDEELGFGEDLADDEDDDDLEFDF